MQEKIDVTNTDFVDFDVEYKTTLILISFTK